MYLLKVTNVSKSYDEREILTNVSFGIYDNQKVALVGKNGTGKSTLMRIIAGVEAPTSGTVEFAGGIKRIGYLKQEFEESELNETVNEYIEENIGIKQLREKLERLEKEDLTLQENFDEFSKVQEEYIELDGYNFDYKKEMTLSGLSLDKSILSRKISTLSGGQKSKVILSTVLLKSSDLLLLDEPTNNLDIKSIEWLEEYLKRIATPILMISHDRSLLDNITSRLIEIDENTKGINEYTGNYTDYILYKKHKLNKQLESFESQQKLIASMTESIRQKKNWADIGRHQIMSDNDKCTRGYERDRSSSNASTAKRIEKQIKRIEKVERPIIKEPLAINISLSPTDRAAVYFYAEDLKCGYPNEFSIQIGKLDIKFGDRILLLGDNGTGKSTFINTLLGNIRPLSGDIRKGNQLKIGVLLQQGFKEFQNQNCTVEEYIKTYTNSDKNVIFTTMIRFGFEYEDKSKIVNILSPGERTRLYLLVCSLNEINTLVLDEPTNFLDIEGLEALEEVVQSFQGILILSSHDRHFIEKISATCKMTFCEGSVERSYTH